MKNYVISLPNATLRRKHICKEFTDKGITFEFFDAFSPSEELNNAIKNLLPNLSLQQNLTQGEKACFISHISLWKKCIDEKLDYITIFEDDVFLGENCHKFLANDDWIKTRFTQKPYIIHLETYLFPSRYEKSNISAYCNRDFYLMKSMHFGAAGYVISNSAAKYLLNLLSEYSAEQLEPIDMIIFHRLLNDSNFDVYQLDPAIIIQEDRLFNKTEIKLFSQLENDRSSLLKKFKKDKKTGVFYKIQRELFRLKRKITHKKVKFA